ncbi:MAG: DUF177 domain-containing protein [Bacteroidetes bacterium]|nr:MAG: DUF177 domain-containing protein [Bacteroidota bacterium]REK00615.1 MAG: DUF177 domain-containing protein [Bacteroidota bacterium]REK48339.1 MAG: DUF177 domain-containing protein [Bacteroidota bacterium]
MSASKEFVIDFGSLEPGEHEFEFEVKDSFFQEYPDSPVLRANLDVLVTMDKSEQMMLLDFTIAGDLSVNCDRCLEELELELETFNELIVKFGESEEEDSEDVIIIPASEHEIDVSRFIYEYITVLIPMRNVHEDEEGNPQCDPEALKNIEKYIKTEKEEGKDDDDNDPRWDALRNINLN